MMFWKCKVCAQKDKQIEYLEKIIDNLLQSKGVAPVAGQAEEILQETEEEKQERALLEKGVVRYGN